MKNAAIKFRNGISRFDTWLASAAGWIVIIMMVTITYDVIMRYAFNMPTKWSFEFNEYFLLAVAFFAGAWTLPSGGHVNVDLLYRRFSQKGQAILELITCSIAIISLALYTWQGMRFTLDAFFQGTKSTEFMAVLQWPIRSFMVIGAILLCLEFIFRLSHYIGVLHGGGIKEMKREET